MNDLISINVLYIYIVVTDIEHRTAQAPQFVSMSDKEKVMYSRTCCAVGLTAQGCSVSGMKHEN